MTAVRTSGDSGKCGDADSAVEFPAEGGERCARMIGVTNSAAEGAKYTIHQLRTAVKGVSSEMSCAT